MAHVIVKLWPGKSDQDKAHLANNPVARPPQNLGSFAFGQLGGLPEIAPHWNLRRPQWVVQVPLSSGTPPSGRTPTPEDWDRVPHLHPFAGIAAARLVTRADPLQTAKPIPATSHGSGFATRAAPGIWGVIRLRRREVVER